jgi:hypothetical protein
VTISNPKKVKIGPKYVDYVFIGYVYNISAYWFLVYKSNINDIHHSTIIESKNLTF